MNNDFLIADLTDEEKNRISSHIYIDLFTECWNWTGALSGRGYGRIKFRRRMEMTHRVLFAWKHGPIPRGIRSDIPILDHICNNRRCCNPDHLRLVLQKENILKGNNRAAINARKTSCPKGHPLVQGSKQRYCPICRREDARKHNIKHPPTKEQRRRAVERVREWRKTHSRHVGQP